MKRLSREDEIRRKIVQLKKKGKVKGGSVAPPDTDSYEQKIGKKLGKKRSQMLGFGDDYDDNDDNDIRRIQDELDIVDESIAESSAPDGQREGQLGAIPDLQADDADELTVISNNPAEAEAAFTSSSVTKDRNLIIDPSLFETDSEEEPEMSEEELVELVAKKLSEKRQEEVGLSEERKQETLETLRSADNIDEDNKSDDDTSEESKKTTTGIGGSWNRNEKKDNELYTPKSSGWGAFPRPKDISKAYGGGRRVGAGFSNEDDVVSAANTKKLLKDYRRKVGIDVPTEKEHAKEIEEALQIGQLAMQRGVYATAVSALEKVTRWCSTNSQVGSKVYLELAMAYEAVGRTSEAYQVYETLTECRMEDVKYNAKRLLYGLQAMEIMRDVSSDFSRKKVKNTFVDTTGLANIADNFDDVYQTAYIDLDSGFYKRLTESVVRSNREARQILMKATGKGEVPRQKVVQALRSISRHFDDALESEITANQKMEPTAYINGKPIFAEPSRSEPRSTSINIDDFVLSSADQMIENIEGAWRLQLLADKSGDGVSFFNTTIAFQKFSFKDMTFSASGPSGLTTVKSAGDITMDKEKRIISRSKVKGDSGGFFSIFGGGKNAGFAGAISREMQIMSVDSILLVTKSPVGSRRGDDAEKEYFGVWRKETKTVP
jgi:tetratricopeptide (TPR) repeat protein